MSAQAVLSLTRRRLTPVFLAVLAFVSMPAAGAEITLSDSSLQLVPADAAFYASFMRNKQQYDAVVTSRAFAALMEMPFVQSMRESIVEGFEDAPPQVALVKDFFDLPENQPLKEMLIEMVSDEVFIYGGKGYSDLFRLQRAANRAVWENMTQQLRRGERDALDVATEESGQGAEEVGPSERETTRTVVKFLRKNFDKLVVPDTVIGFKLTDVQRARQQLERLEPLIKMALEQQPQLKKAYARKKIAGAEFFTLNIDGSMIPWDQLQLEEQIRPYEDKPGEFDDVIAKIKKLTLAVGLGIRGNHLLLLIGSTNEHLEKLGQYELLVKSEKAAPLGKLVGKPVASIGYVSDEFAHAIGAGEDQIDQYVALFDAMLDAQARELTTEIRDRAKKDLRELGEDVKSLLPRPGAMLTMTVLTKRGYARLTYNWAENRALDGSKPLTILNHVGGDPILFAAVRTPYSLDGYRMLTKWLGKLQYYADELGQQEMTDQQRGQYKMVRDLAAPFWPRLDKVTSEVFLPAFNDGQSAFVLDSRLSSQQWHAMMPPASKPLPMLEPAIVCGLSDAELLKKACSQYVAIINEAAAKMAELAPDEAAAAGFEFPLPRTRSFPGEGTFYYYRVPAEAGVDKQIVPTAGLSEEFLTLAVSAKHARRLLNPSTPTAGIPLRNTDRPLASATHFSFSRLIDAVAPWIEYGTGLVIGAVGGLLPDEGGLGGGGPGDETISAIADQIQTGLKILKCFRSYTSATYVEDDALVTHSEWHFQDLEP